MSDQSNGSDFTFSSSAEVKTFVRAQLGLPSKESKGMLDQRIANFKTMNGRKLSEVNDLDQAFGLQMSKSYLFRMFLNPVVYDGRFLREMKNSYKTNELGFFIAFSFFGCLFWSFARYRRNAILE